MRRLWERFTPPASTPSPPSNSCSPTLEPTTTSHRSVTGTRRSALPSNERSSRLHLVAIGGSDAGIFAVLLMRGPGCAGARRMAADGVAGRSPQLAVSGPVGHQGCRRRLVDERFCGVPGAPVPTADEQRRETAARAAEEAASGPEWTQDAITGPTGDSQPLRKRHAILELVQRLHQAGVPAIDLAGAISGARVLPVDGLYTAAELATSFVARYPKAEGNLRRWQWTAEPARHQPTLCCCNHISSTASTQRLFALVRVRSSFGRASRASTY